MKIEYKVVTNLVVFFVFILIAYLNLKRDSNNISKIRNEIYEQFKYQKFNGLVIKKYLDSNDHECPHLVIENFNNTLYDNLFSFDSSGFYNFIKLNDTVKKDSGSLDIYIKNNLLDTVFHM